MRPASQSIDFDLNLAPIIDCLTVLIAFVLISTAFVSIGILDAGTAAGGAAQTASAAPVTLTVQLRADGGYALRARGEQSSDESASDLEGLSRLLGSAVSRWAGVTSATLQADNGVPYKDVVRTMETMRRTVPQVLLGGF